MPSLTTAQPEAQPEVQAHRHTGTQAHRHTGTQARRHTGTQAHRHTGTQAHRRTAAHRLTDRVRPAGPKPMMAATVLVNVDDYERHAAQVLPRMVWDYYSSGTRRSRSLSLSLCLSLSHKHDTCMYVCMCVCVGGAGGVAGANDQQTLRDNVDAFARVRLRPRVLVPLERVSLATTVLGQPVHSPLCVAPTAMQRMAHPDGEAATARGTYNHASPNPPTPHTYLHTHTDTHTQTHTNTHTHTHTHTATSSSSSDNSTNTDTQAQTHVHTYSATPSAH
jgi:hypothetical protein